MSASCQSCNQAVGNCNLTEWRHPVVHNCREPSGIVPRSNLTSTGPLGEMRLEPDAVRSSTTATSSNPLRNSAPLIQLANAPVFPQRPAELAEHIRLLKIHHQLAVSLINTFVNEMNAVVRVLQQLRSVTAISVPIEAALQTLVRLRTSFGDLSQKCQLYLAYQASVNTMQPSLQLANIDVLRNNVEILSQCLNTLSEVFNELHQWTSPSTTLSIEQGLYLSNCLFRHAPVLTRQLQLFSNSLTELLSTDTCCEGATACAKEPICDEQNLHLEASSRDKCVPLVNSELSVPIDMSSTVMSQPIVIQPDGQPDTDETLQEPTLITKVKVEKIEKESRKQLRIRSTCTDMIQIDDEITLDTACHTVEDEASNQTCLLFDRQERDIPSSSSSNQQGAEEECGAFSADSTGRQSDLRQQADDETNLTTSSGSLAKVSRNDEYGATDTAVMSLGISTVSESQAATGLSKNSKPVLPVTSVISNAATVTNVIADDVDITGVADLRHCHVSEPNMVGSTAAANSDSCCTLLDSGNSGSVCVSGTEANRDVKMNLVPAANENGLCIFDQVSDCYRRVVFADANAAEMENASSSSDCDTNLAFSASNISSSVVANDNNTSNNVKMVSNNVVSCTVSVRDLRTTYSGDNNGNNATEKTVSNVALAQSDVYDNSSTCITDHKLSKRTGNNVASKDAEKTVTFDSYCDHVTGGFDDDSPVSDTRKIRDSHCVIGEIELTPDVGVSIPSAVVPVDSVLHSLAICTDSRQADDTCRAQDQSQSAVECATVSATNRDQSQLGDANICSALSAHTASDKSHFSLAEQITSFIKTERAEDSETVVTSKFNTVNDSRITSDTCNNSSIGSSRADLPCLSAKQALNNAEDSCSTGNVDITGVARMLSCTAGDECWNACRDEPTIHKDAAKNFNDRSITDIIEAVIGVTTENKNLSGQVTSGSNCNGILEDAGIFRISSVCSVKSEKTDNTGSSMQKFALEDVQPVESDDIIMAIRSFSRTAKLSFVICDDSWPSVTDKLADAVKTEVAADDCNLMFPEEQLDKTGLDNDDIACMTLKTELTETSDDPSLTETIQAVQDIVAQNVLCSGREVYSHRNLNEAVLKQAAVKVVKRRRKKRSTGRKNKKKSQRVKRGGAVNIGEFQSVVINTSNMTSAGDDAAYDDGIWKLRDRHNREVSSDMCQFNVETDEIFAAMEKEAGAACSASTVLCELNAGMHEDIDLASACEPVFDTAEVKCSRRAKSMARRLSSEALKLKINLSGDDLTENKIANTETIKSRLSAQEDFHVTGVKTCEEQRNTTAASSQKKQSKKVKRKKKTKTGWSKKRKTRHTEQLNPEKSVDADISNCPEATGKNEDVYHPSCEAEARLSSVTEIETVVLHSTATEKSRLSAKDKVNAIYKETEFLPLERKSDLGRSKKLTKLLNICANAGPSHKTAVLVNSQIKPVTGDCNPQQKCLAKRDLSANALEHSNSVNCDHTHSVMSVMPVSELTCNSSANDGNNLEEAMKSVPSANEECGKKSEKTSALFSSVNASSSAASVNRSNYDPVYYTGIMQNYIPSLMSLYVEPAHVSRRRQMLFSAKLPEGLQPGTESSVTTFSMRDPRIKIRHNAASRPMPPGIPPVTSNEICWEGWKFSLPLQTEGNPSTSARRVSFEKYVHQSLNRPKTSPVQIEAHDICYAQRDSAEVPDHAPVTQTQTTLSASLTSIDILSELSTEDSAGRPMNGESSWHSAKRVIRCSSGTMLPNTERNVFQKGCAVNNSSVMSTGTNHEERFEVDTSELLALDDLQVADCDQPCIEDVDLVLKFPATRMNGMFWKLSPVDISVRACSFYIFLSERLQSIPGSMWEIDPRLNRKPVSFCQPLAVKKLNSVDTALEPPVAATDDRLQKQLCQGSDLMTSSNNESMVEQNPLMKVENVDSLPNTVMHVMSKKLDSQQTLTDANGIASLKFKSSQNNVDQITITYANDNKDDSCSVLTAASYVGVSCNEASGTEKGIVELSNAVVCDMVAEELDIQAQRDSALLNSRTEEFYGDLMIDLESDDSGSQEGGDQCNSSLVILNKCNDEKVTTKPLPLPVHHKE